MLCSHYTAGIGFCAGVMGTSDQLLFHVKTMCVMLPKMAYCIVLMRKKTTAHCYINNGINNLPNMVNIVYCSKLVYD